MLASCERDATESSQRLRGELEGGQELRCHEPECQHSSERRQGDDADACARCSQEAQPEQAVDESELQDVERLLRLATQERESQEDRQRQRPAGARLAEEAVKGPENGGEPRFGGQERDVGETQEKRAREHVRRRGAESSYATEPEAAGKEPGEDPGHRDVEGEVRLECPRRLEEGEQKQIRRIEHRGHVEGEKGLSRVLIRIPEWKAPLTRARRG